MGGTIDAQGVFHFDNNTNMESDIEALRRYAQRKLGNADPNRFAISHGSDLPATIPRRGRGRFVFSDSPGMGGWKQQHLQRITIPQLQGKYYIQGAYERAFGQGRAAMRDYWAAAAERRGGAGNTTVTVNVLVADQLQALFRAWETNGLLDAVLYQAGFFYARYMGPEGRPNRPISNHAFGTAFDINAMHNLQSAGSGVPRGGLGSVITLVPLALDHNFAWGGLFSGGSRDLMHFEVAKLPGE